MPCTPFLNDEDDAGPGTGVIVGVTILLVAVFGLVATVVTILAVLGYRKYHQVKVIFTVAIFTVFGIMLYLKGSVAVLLHYID